MKAFPNQIEMIDHVNYREVMKGGMDLRDYFAAKAMELYIDNGQHHPDATAKLAYQYADAMMEARK